MTGIYVYSVAEAEAILSSFEDDVVNSQGLA